MFNQTLTSIQIPYSGLKHASSIFSSVSFGIPCPEGVVTECADLVLVSPDGSCIDSVFSSLMAWPDGSHRWLQCHALLPTDCGFTAESLTVQLCKKQGVNPAYGLSWHKKGDLFVVESGLTSFQISKSGSFLPLHQFKVQNQQYDFSSSTGLQLLDAAGEHWSSVIDECHVVHESPVCLELNFRGGFARQKQRHDLRFNAAVRFFADTQMVDCSVTLTNPKAAQHTKNLWDLGDPGSVEFQSCALELSPEYNAINRSELFLNDSADAIVAQGDWSVYQASSGGELMNCSQHNDQHGMGPEFSGYQVWIGEQEVYQGQRTSPIVLAQLTNLCMGVYLDDFWQNFPKNISGDDSSLRLSLFPEQTGKLHELQGGEQKTHHFTIQFADNSDLCRLLLAFKSRKYTPVFQSDWSSRCLESGSLLSGIRNNQRNGNGFNETCLNFLVAALNEFGCGKSSAFVRRELIDEYGWRNFGELYADHEAVFHQGVEPFISHYNNQYDAIKGLLLQFFQTGKQQWFQLAKDLADHVIDIDIYHTDEDRYQYNHGLFWHTDHHLPAATATHRAFSKAHLEHNPHTGGGPAPDHNYATGLMLMYLLTGEQRYREGALELVENIRQLVLGPDTICEHLFQKVKVILRKVKRQPQVGDPAYSHVFGLFDGPGRASGNALNTLLDGFLLTQNSQYLALADYIICHCVSDQDDLEALGLRNPELRWMYTIFLKSLARYIKVKKEYQQSDSMLEYASKSFLHYSNWMLKNEYFYLDKPELLEFPNETWAAQELRKADILAFAASMTSGQMRRQFFDKARYFFDTAIQRLQEYDQPLFTRPLVLMMVNGWDYLSLQSEFDKETLDDSVVANSANNVPNPDYEPIKVRTLFRTFKKLKFQKEIKWFKQRI